MYSSIHVLTSELDVVSDQLEAPAALPRRMKGRFPTNRRLGGLQNQSIRFGEKRFSYRCEESGRLNSVVQPTASPRRSLGCRG
jgi:hypothetical protein